MKNETKSIVIISVAIVVLFFLAASVYIMFPGMGRPCAPDLKGSVKRIYISPDRSLVRYSLSLQQPDKVKNWSQLYLYMNISGKTFALDYNSSAKIWQHGNYTAELYDRNDDGAIDTGDVLDFVNHSGSFSRGDEALICVSGYSGNIPTPLWEGTK